MIASTVKENLKSRHLDLNFSRVWIDERERTAVFPLWNLSGQFEGYQQYRPDAGKERNNNPRLSRYFTYAKKGRCLPLWGLESWKLSNTLYLVEGIFDAARLHRAGLSTLALLSNDPKPEIRTWLNCLGRPTVAICDPDAAGAKLAKFGHRAELLENSDVGDLTETEFKQLLEKLNER